MSVTSWCGGHQLDPVNCPIGTVLEYLQACSSTGLTHSTLKVYVAALLAYHAPLGGQSVGRHPLETSFLQRLRPPAREVCCVRMLFHSLESSDLPSSWGSRLTSQKLAFGTQAPPTLALVLAAVACRVEAQNLSRGEGSYFAGLRGAWSSSLSVWAHSTGVWFPLKLLLE